MIGAGGKYYSLGQVLILTGWFMDQCGAEIV